jgi:hypothetical protein
MLTFVKLTRFSVLVGHSFGKYVTSKFNIKVLDNTNLENSISLANQPVMLLEEATS